MSEEYKWPKPIDHRAPAQHEADGNGNVLSASRGVWVPVLWHTIFAGAPWLSCPPPYVPEKPRQVPLTPIEIVGKWVRQKNTNFCCLAHGFNEVLVFAGAGSISMTRLDQYEEVIIRDGKIVECKPLTREARDGE